MIPLPTFPYWTWRCPSFNGVHSHRLSLSTITCPLTQRTIIVRTCSSYAGDDADSGPGSILRGTIPKSKIRGKYQSIRLIICLQYFSSLERLRLANASASAMSSNTPVKSHSRGSSLLDRRVLTAPDGLSRPKPLPRTLRDHVRQRTLSTHETSWFLTRPEKSARRRQSNASSRGYKSRSSSILQDVVGSASPSTPKRSLRSSPSKKADSPAGRPSLGAADATMDNTFYNNNFRWMEDTDLDLRLAPFDNYHANVDGVVIPSPTSTRRPSFRRQMSVSGLPFSRNSTSQPQSPKPDSPPRTHTRQHSRAMSLILPRQTPEVPLGPIETNAAHYQDPEARMKLRVYLASPQNFDEAIEFGFPSLDEQQTENKENKPPARQSRDRARTPALTSPRTFFNDDMQDAESMFFDDKSDVESEAPRTPLENEFGYPQALLHKTVPLQSMKNKNSADYSHLGLKRPTVVKVQDTYAQASNREMTLRMTLTRPDLRADESSMYGINRPAIQPVTVPWDMEDREDLKGPLGGHDGWGLPDKDGVVRRLWQRVRQSSQRKTS